MDGVADSRSGKIARIKTFQRTGKTRRVAQKQIPDYQRGNGELE
jgi:hypothetical protein